MLEKCPANLPILTSSVADEVGDVCRYLEAVLSGDLGPVESIASQMRASKEGGRALVPHALSLDEHWKGLQAEARKLTLASASLGPQMKALVGAMERKEKGACERTLTKLVAMLVGCAPQSFNRSSVACVGGGSFGLASRVLGCLHSVSLRALVWGQGHRPRWQRNFHAPT